VNKVTNKRTYTRRKRQLVDTALDRLLHKYLCQILDGVRYTPNERQAYIKLWYDGELTKLRKACMILINVCDSIEAQREDALAAREHVESLLKLDKEKRL
jgi:hypothetical protein